MCGDGPEMDVTLLCDDTLMGTMVDRFGDGFSFDVPMPTIFSRKYTLTPAARSGVGCLQSAGKMKIIGPDWAKEQYSACLHAALSA